LLNFTEAAAYLGIGEHRLRELLKERRLPEVTKDGSRLRFPKAMLDKRRAFLRQLREKQGPHGVGQSKARRPWLKPTTRARSK